MAKIDEYIKSVNANTLHPAGLALVDPAKTAYLFIELEYY